MLDTTNDSLLQYQYLAEIEQANRDKDDHGDYTREGLEHLTEAAKIQLRLAELSTGQVSAGHQRTANDLIQQVHTIMLRKNMIAAPEPPKQKEPETGKAPARSTPAKPRKEARQAENAAKVNDEMPDFDAASYIVQPGKVRIEEAAATAAHVVEELKTAVKDNFSELYPNLPQPPHRVGHRLLYGPPGSGKTFLCKGLATYVAEQYPNTAENPKNSAFFLLKIGDIISRYVGTAENRIKGVFEEAETYNFAVICIDEVDRLFSSRAQEDKKANYTASLLELLDGVAGKTKAMVILATNHPEQLDSALLSRIGRATYMGYPEMKALENALRRCTYLHSGLGDTPQQQEEAISFLAERAAQRHFSFRNMEVLYDDLYRQMRTHMMEAYPEGSSQVTTYIPLTRDELSRIVNHVTVEYDAKEDAALREYRKLHGG
ncbi:MAG: ATP-binding protein [Aristaeellaceae bacterium]